MRQMSHDMRGVLATLQLTSDMLMQGTYGALTSEQGRATQRIQRNTQRMVTLIDDIMTYVKIETDQYALKPMPFEPRALLANLYQQIAPLAEAKGLTLHWTIADHLPERLVGDGAEISRMVLALLWNAIGFTAKGDVWMDSGWTSDGQWLTTVRDTGPGIPAETQPSLFQPFYRGDQRPQMPSSGFGVGLAMTAALAKLMNGQVLLEKSGSEGSTFRLQLPLDMP